MAGCNIEEIGVAVDLGSTTIAIQCFDMNSKDNIGEITFPNPQYRYGADVITRIRHCIDEPRMADTLKSIVWDAIFAGIQRCSIYYGDYPYRDLLMHHLKRLR